VEEGGVVGAFFAGVQVRAFGVGAQDGGSAWDGAGGETGEDLLSLLSISLRLVESGRWEAHFFEFIAMDGRDGWVEACHACLWEVSGDFFQLLGV